MIIDLREIPVVWINLDSATKNAEAMQEKLQKHGFKNTHRKSARVIPAPPGTIASNAHYVGCAQSHIDILDNANYSDPLLILEDDAEFSDAFNPIIEIPDDSDGIYLGVSTGNQGYQTKRYNSNYLRIGGILATHAILYVNKNFKECMSSVAQHCINDLQQPWDLGASSIQFQTKVYTPNKPYFYQSDNRNSANKWQFFTDQELEERNSVYL
jgi:hypothetical protein